MNSTIDLTYITHTFEFYSIIIVCGIGFVTNFMNIQVNLRPNIQKKSTMGFYNICLSISSSFALIFIGFLLLFPQSLGTNLLVSSDIVCRIVPYFAFAFTELNAWLNVMVSIDRVVLMSYENPVAYNTKFHRLRERRTLFLIVASLITFILIINVPGLFFYLSPRTTLQDPLTNLTKIIDAECTANQVVRLVRDSIFVIFRTLLPLFIQILLSCILVYKLLKLKINVRTLSLKKEYVFTMTIVVFNLIFILSDLLVLTTTILINVYGYSQAYVSSMSNESAIASFAHVVAIVIVLFNYFDLLFFVNLILHSKFRREARKLYVDWTFSFAKNV